jgi:hypothetical protein
MVLLAALFQSDKAFEEDGHSARKTAAISISGRRMDNGSIRESGKRNPAGGIGSLIDPRRQPRAAGGRRSGVVTPAARPA